MRFMLGLMVCVALVSCALAQDSTVAQDATAKVDDRIAESFGWKLGVQTYSFNRFTLFEAIDKAASVGLKYAEAYPGQKICGDCDDKMGPGMSEAAYERVAKKLADAGVQLVAFGVTGLSGDEAESRKTFDFCKRFGIGVINTEAREDAFDTIEKLAKEYQIKVGIHNHPEPSYYWNPDKVLQAIEGRGPWIGACADTGHWMRSGLDPLDCLKKLEGRIVSFHFKDLNQKGKGAHDVPWGQGQANAKALIQEMKRQNFRGPVSIEYEHNWLESLPEIGQCVQNFHKFAGQLKND